MMSALRHPSVMHGFFKTLRTLPSLFGASMIGAACLMSTSSAALASGFETSFAGASSGFGSASAFGGSAFGASKAFGGPVTDAPTQPRVALPVLPVRAPASVRSVAKPTSKASVFLSLKFEYAGLSRSLAPMIGEDLVDAVASANGPLGEDLAFDGLGGTDVAVLDNVRGMAPGPDDEAIRTLITAAGSVNNNSTFIGGDFTPSNVIDNGALQGAQGAVTIIQNAANNVVIETQMNVTVNIGN